MGDIRREKQIMFIKRHKTNKRKREVKKIIWVLRDYLKNRNSNNQGNLKILEFGCGNGFQTRYLQLLGNVTSIDIYKNKEINNKDDINFIKASIDETPFDDEQFDIIYSNHVIEHLINKKSAFNEIKRILKKDGLVVFAVPTNIWLLFSLPAKYYNKIKLFFGINKKKEKMNFSYNKKQEKNIISKILPNGHGIESNYLKCYKNFRIKSWNSFFKEFEFNIYKTVPLDFYVPSSLPYLPTTSILSKYNFCSSVLFIMTPK